MSRFNNFLVVISFFLFKIGISSCFANESFDKTSIDTTSVWRVNYVTDNGSGGTFFIHNNYKYFIKGDTLINSILYKKLYKSGLRYKHDFFNNVFSNYSYYNNVYSGAIRESEGKWFYYTNEYYPNVDTLLYDFNLEIGDTLPESYTTPGDYYVVSDIDSIFVNGCYKKQFYFDDSSWDFIGPPVIIEGIGSYVGLLEPMCQFEFIWYLVCYVENGVSYWGASIGDCDLTVNIDDLNINKTGLSIFPNPVKRINKLITVCNNNETGELRIYNCLGNLVKKIRLEKSESIFVNISDLKSGIYIITANMDNGFTYASKQIVE